MVLDKLLSFGFHAGLFNSEKLYMGLKKDLFLSDTDTLRRQLPGVNVYIDLKGPLTGTTRDKKGQSLRVLQHIPKPGKIHKCMQFAPPPKPPKHPPPPRGSAVERICFALAVEQRFCL